MDLKQLKNSFFLFVGNVLLKISNFGKQLLFAYFLGISKDIDILLVAQIIPLIINSMFGGSGGEVLITRIKKKESVNDRMILLFLVIVQILSILLALLVIPFHSLISEMFSLQAEDLEMFQMLSLIFFLNLIPANIVSVLKEVLFYKEKFKYFIYTSLISELVGIVVICLFTPRIGIYAFAIGILCVSVINALLFMSIIRLNYFWALRKRIWYSEWANLLVLLRGLFSLSIQTLINRFSTLWERFLSMIYLTSGYLSGFNYAKTLSEMPQGVLMSSLLTTTYVEQIRQKEKGDHAFMEYSHRMYKIISVFAILVQIGLIIAAPVLLIIFFRRGKFDNQAVEDSMQIINILLLGLFPLILSSFFVRTLYVAGKFRTLFKITVFKVILQLSMLFGLVGILQHILPISYVFGYFLLMMSTALMISRSLPGIVNVGKLLVKIITVSAISFGFVYINTLILPYLIQKTNFKVMIIGLPVLMILLTCTVIIMNQKGYFRFLKGRNEET